MDFSPYGDPDGLSVNPTGPVDGAKASLGVVPVLAVAMFAILTVSELLMALTLRRRTVAWREFYVNRTAYSDGLAGLADENMIYLAKVQWVPAILLLVVLAVWVLMLMRSARRAGLTEVSPTRTAALWLLPILGPPYAIRAMQQVVVAAGESEQRLLVWLRLMVAYFVFNIASGMLNARPGGIEQGGMEVLAALNREVTLRYFSVAFLVVITIAAARAISHASHVVASARRSPIRPLEPIS